MKNLGEKQPPGFIPSHALLGRREPKTRITLELTEPSLSHFRRLARQEKTPYQRTVRSSVTTYTDQYNPEMVAKILQAAKAPGIRFNNPDEFMAALRDYCEK